MTPNPHWIGASQALSEARSLMREHGIRHLPVLREAKLVGVLSERDINLLHGVPGVRAETLPAEDAMTPAPFTATRDAPLVEVARTMATHKVGSAVVLEEGRVVGVFTTTDALDALADALTRNPSMDRKRGS